MANRGIIARLLNWLRPGARGQPTGSDQHRPSDGQTRARFESDTYGNRGGL